MWTQEGQRPAVVHAPGGSPEASGLGGKVEAVGEPARGPGDGGVSGEPPGGGEDEEWWEREEDTVDLEADPLLARRNRV